MVTIDLESDKNARAQFVSANRSKLFVAISSPRGLTCDLLPIWDYGSGADREQPFSDKGAAYGSGADRRSVDFLIARG